jgi:PAS domain S-box-containing protein
MILKKHLSKYDSALQILNHSFLWLTTDNEGVFREVNPKICEISQYSEQELIGKNCNEIIPKEATDAWNQHLEEVKNAIQEKGIWHGEVERTSKYGNVYWTYTVICPVVNEEGETEEYLNISRIITRRKEAEQKLYLQSQYLREYAFLTSHYLRRPLASLLGLIELITSNTINNDSAFEEKMTLITHLKNVAEDLDVTIHDMQDKIQKAEEKRNQALSKKGITKIMLIDDDPLNNMVTKKLIEHLDKQISVSIFKNAKQALDYLAKETNELPDLILLDVEMPEINGWEFLYQFEQMSLGIPVYILSVSLDIKDQYQARDYQSVRNFFIKPLKASQLEKILA